MPETINLGYPARADLDKGIPRYEADALERFTYVSTVIIPATTQFIVYHTDGSTLAPVTAQSGMTVTVSAAASDIGSIGLYYVDRQLPSSTGFYTYEWRSFGSSGASSGAITSSLFVIAREMFEIIRTEPRSFTSYGNKALVLRAARTLVGRSDLTERDIEPNMLAAYGYINGRLAPVITVPVSPTPNYVAQGEEILALYSVYGHYGKGDIPQAYKDMRENFLEYIDAVIAGSAAIDAGGTIALKEDDIAQITGGIKGGTPTFGRRDWIEQSVDTDITEDEEDASN